MEDFGWLIFIIAAWALIYAFVVERRRSRDAEQAGEKIALLEKRLGGLHGQVEKLLREAPGAVEAAAQPAAAPVTTVATVATAAPSPAVHTCSRCGYHLPSDYEFCIRCGAKVAKAAAKPEAVSAPPAVPAVSRPIPATTSASASESAPKTHAPLTVPKPVQPVSPVSAPAATSSPAPPPPAPGTPSSPLTVSKPAPPTSAVAAPAATSAPATPAPSKPTSPPLRINVPPAVASPGAAGPSAGEKTTPRPVAVPSFAQPKPTKPKRSIEEVLGMKLLPIIGIAIVVIGVGFLVGQAWHLFPHSVRALLLYAGSLGMLGLGIFLERRNRYQMLGHALIGGGWAVIATLTYAIGNRDSLRLFTYEPLDLSLLMLVIAAMVVHTLKYESQIVTGAAFLLGFLAIGMNPAPPFNLIAGGMLILGMTVIVIRRQWFELEATGIVAAYANHFIWLYRVYEEQGGRAIFPHHTASVALVIGYWVIFRASYLARKISAGQQETVSTVAALLNPILFLAVMKYQGFHPEWAWWLLLAMGAVEFTLGQLPVARRRRAPFQILSSLGFVLMVAAIPVKYSGNSLDLVWLAGAEAFLLAGVFTRERLFRAFGLIVSFLVAVHAADVLIEPLVEQVLGNQPQHDGRLSLVLAVIAATLYANAHVTRRLWPQLFAEQIEDLSLSVLSFVASAFAASAIYAYVPDPWIAVALALLLTWLSGTGKFFAIPEMVYEAHWIAGAAFIQVVVRDSAVITTWWKIPHRVLAFAVVAALLYLSSRFVRLSETLSKTVFSALYAWSATALLASLIWYQFQWPGWAVAVLWIALALALSIIGQYLGRVDLKWQAFALVVGSTLRALAFNFDLGQALSDQSGSMLSHISYRLFSVSLSALGIYLLARWAPLKEVRPVYTAIGTGLLAYLIYRESATPWTAVAWITLALVLSLAARRWKDRALLWQTHAMAAMAVLWSLYLFYFEPQYRGTRVQWITVSITAVLLYGLTWITNIKSMIGDERVCQAYAWAGSLLVSWLIWAQLNASNVSLAWAVFGVLLYELPDLLGSLKVDCTKAAASWHGQAYFALVSSFVYIFLANFNAPRAVGLDVFKDPHVVPVMLLPFLYFYVYWRVRRSAGSDEEQAKSMAKVVAA
jgi:hypothetical protein